MQGGAVRRDLREPPLDGGVDVFVRVRERESARVQLPLDAPQPALDRLELRGLQDSGGGQAPGVGDAARDVKRIQLEVDLQGRRVSL
jgi:hypothetical protein